MLVNNAGLLARKPALEVTADDMRAEFDSVHWATVGDDGPSGGFFEEAGALPW